MDVAIKLISSAGDQVMKLAQFTMGILALGLCACGANPEGIGTVEPPPDVPTVNVITDPAFKLPANAQQLGEVTGSSCKSGITQPEPTQDQAIRRLQVAAAEKGANVVTNVTFSTEGASLTGCWAIITAKGEAYRIPPAPAPRKPRARS